MGLCVLAFAVSASSVAAAPYAAMVMDARSGKVLHARNADTRLHPASLTKMMTLYVTFEAIRRGELTLDTKVKISRKAAAEQPSKLGLKAGQRIAIRYLIRAAAVKSANDAATALGEAVSGSEATFARRMTRTAKALGMTNTTFKNAHGLTESGHMSTARDMTTLGRHMIYDYPQYYNLFSRQTTHAGVKQVSNTNRRFLQNYKGADGIKTGYTRAAGFNLVASAEKGNERIIATMFGGSSTAARNARVAELLDMGFKRAPSNTALRKPSLPSYRGVKEEPKIIKVKPTITAVPRSPRPTERPEAAPSPEMLLAVVKDVNEQVTSAREEVQVAKAASAPTVTPIKRPGNLVTAALQPTEIVRKPAQRQIITRASTSGGRHWGITLGYHTTRHSAERMLLQTALQEIETLSDALRKVANKPKGWEANFVGMTKERANLACARLEARGQQCETRGPTG
ncbi:D-alanyl-D-alanine carboxypeptidase family protein [uncultured Litoreibacter sp.]|uniref:D-alanyl-D-alanine carboxypeptidase family protein n=1 Tax=uncultured Litoreibacter sp. TaxID=1392394 RepID=UPI0026331C89|nr:serine hydrolase [uncultured Litoreibacter sp.]